jgi:hypothetical protein
MNAWIHKAAKNCTIAAAFFLMFLFLIGQSVVAQSTTFKGEIADEHLNCIQTPMKVPDDMKDKLSCVLYYAHFVKPASRYVFYDPATKTTYQLDDQDQVQPYVGTKTVQITGTLDAATKTIHVKEIKVP